jgi:hypothetical protein
MSISQAPAALTITIPAVVMALPDLTLHQRVVLARLHEKPDHSNAAIADLLDLSVSGIEVMLRRLRERKLIETVYVGKTAIRRVLLSADDHKKSGQPVEPDAQKISGQNSEDPAQEKVKYLVAEIHRLDKVFSTQGGALSFKSALDEFRSARMNLLGDTTLSDIQRECLTSYFIEKVRFLRVLARYESDFHSLSKQNQLAAAKVIFKATPEQLDRLTANLERLPLLADALELLGWPVATLFVASDSSHVPETQAPVAQRTEPSSRRMTLREQLAAQNSHEPATQPG